MNKYGNLKKTGFLECEEVVEVLNPLQDPHVTSAEKRGTIDDVTIGALAADFSYSTSQAVFLQNLGGKNSLIGRSVVFTSVNTTVETDFVNYGCCVIGLDAPPAPATQV